MKFKISTCIVAAGLFFGASAFARGGGGSGSSGIIFDLNAFYNATKSETTNTGGSATVESDSTTALYDIKLGYLMDSGLYVGGIYNSRSSSLLDQSGKSGSAMGASVGYMSTLGIFIQGHYLLNGTYYTYSEGTGMQADLGYKAGVGGGWLLGAEITYRNMDYKKNSSSAALSSYKVTEVLPMVSVGYMF